MLRRDYITCRATRYSQRIISIYIERLTHVNLASEFTTNQSIHQRDFELEELVFMHALNLFNECEFGHKLESKECTDL